MVYDLRFKVPLVDVWKIDCGRARREEGKPVRRLLQLSWHRRVVETRVGNRGGGTRNCGS